MMIIANVYYYPQESYKIFILNEELCLFQNEILYYNIIEFKSKATKSIRVYKNSANAEICIKLFGNIQYVIY